MSLRILLGDDHQLTLEGIRRTLDDAPGMEVVATANCGPDVMTAMSRCRPDLAVLDIRMPGMDGLACLDQIRRKHPDVKVVILSGFTDRQHIEAALKRGASAYIVKSVDPVDLPSALRQACQGTVFHAFGRIESTLDKAREDAELTEREMTILGAVARGLANKAISKELWVTEQTVKFHLNNVYRKLGVNNRTAAVRFAFDNGLIDVEHGVLEPA
jgi:DNA-binding NarL/FixJ family response regulator